MKKCIALLTTMAFMFVFCFSAPVLANDGPVFAPSMEEKGVLESYTTEQYVDEDGFIVTEETFVYNCTSARSTTTKKTVAKNYILSTDQAGDILVITLDADFYYIVDGSVYCDRYYSSYNICNADRHVSHAEIDKAYNETDSTAKIQTYYKLEYKEKDAFGLTEHVRTKKPSIWILVNNQGKTQSGIK